VDATAALKLATLGAGILGNESTNVVFELQRDGASLDQQLTLQREVDDWVRELRQRENKGIVLAAAVCSPGETQ
jgi:hypothetical protein